MGNDIRENRRTGRYRRAACILLSLFIFSLFSYIVLADVACPPGSRSAPPGMIGPIKPVAGPVPEPSDQPPFEEESDLTCIPESVLPTTLYDFIIDSSAGITTIIGIARQNIAIGVKKAPVRVAPGAVCLPIVADLNYDLDFLKKTYGQTRQDVESQLDTMQFMDHTVRVHRLISTAVGCVEQEILRCQEGSDYDFRLIDSYAWRFVESNPNMLATSSFGISLNINLDTNFNTQDGTLTTDIPECIVNAFKRFGFKWGGDYENSKCPAHFEFMADPNMIAALSEQAVVDVATQTPVCTRSGINLVDNIVVNTPDYGPISLSPSQECPPPCKRDIITRPDFVINMKNKKKYFVVHTTVGGERTIQRFRKGVPGSPHTGTQYVISRRGEIFQIAMDDAFIIHSPRSSDGIGVEDQNAEGLCTKICKGTFCSPEDCRPRPSFPENPGATDRYQKSMFGKTGEWWSDAQKKALLKLAAETMVRYDIPIEKLVRHADLSAEVGKGHVDPGPQFDWMQFKSNVHAAINQYHLKAGNCKESSGAA